MMAHSCLLKADSPYWCLPETSSSGAYGWMVHHRYCLTHSSIVLRKTLVAGTRDEPIPRVRSFFFELVLPSSASPLDRDVDPPSYTRSASSEKPSPPALTITSIEEDSQLYIDGTPCSLPTFHTWSKNTGVRSLTAAEQLIEDVWERGVPHVSTLEPKTEEKRRVSRTAASFWADEVLFCIPGRGASGGLKNARLVSAKVRTRGNIISKLSPSLAVEALR